MLSPPSVPLYVRFSIPNPTVACVLPHFYLLSLIQLCLLLIWWRITGIKLRRVPVAILFVAIHGIRALLILKSTASFFLFFLFTKFLQESLDGANLVVLSSAAWNRLYLEVSSESNSFQLPARLQLLEKINKTWRVA